MGFLLTVGRLMLLLDGLMYAGGCAPSPVSTVDPSNIDGSPAAFLSDAPWGAAAQQTIPRHASQSIVRFVATRTIERVRLRTTAQGATPDLYITVFQNGVYFASILLVQDTSTYAPQYATIAGLTVGAVVDLCEASQGPVGAVAPGVPIQGTYVEGLYDSAPFRTAPVRATVVYGNSYMGGYGAPAPNARYSVPTLLRAAHPSGAPGVAVRQWSSNGFLVFSDATHETAAQQAAALVDLCRGTGSNEIAIIALERNDWFYNSGNAAAVAARAGAVCDLVNGAAPAVKILLAAVWLTLSEGVNAGGQTLPAYRAAYLGAASGRAWVSALDLSSPAVMPTWNTATDLFDDSHPNAAGYVKVFTAIRANLPLGAI